MSLKVYLQKLYFESYIYITYSILQLALVLALIVYILIDFDQRINTTLVFRTELFLASLMLLDIILYNYLNDFRFSLLTLLECLVILSFIAIYVYMLIKGFSRTREETELGLLIARFVLQICRLSLGVLRTKTYLEEKNAINDVNINIGSDREIKAENQDVEAYA